jgi:quinol monooxygenase YgiN
LGGGAAGKKILASQVTFADPDRLSGSRRQIEARSRRFRSHSMTVNLSTGAPPVTLVNILTVEPADQPELLALLQDTTEKILSTLSGWKSTCLIASDDKQRIIIFSRWESIADVDAMRRHPKMTACFPRLTALASFDSFIA